MVGSLDLGDADRIVRLLTASEGRVSVAVRRARAKSGPVTALGARVRVVLSPGRGGLSSARSVEAAAVPVRARDSLDRIALLAYGCELCAALAPEGAPAPKLAGLLEHWLALLEGPEAPGVAARVALEAKATTFAGLGPALARCAACGAPIDDPCVFDAESGGALHARCGGGVRVGAADLRRVDALRRTPLAALGPTAPVGVPPWLLTGFVEHHLGRALASRGWLEASGSGGSG